MKEINLGDLVISNQGRDKGVIYLITKKLPNNYFLCINGDNKKIENPKKKIKRHITPLEVNIEKIRVKLENETKVYDSEIFSAIKKYKESINIENV